MLGQGQILHWLNDAGVKHHVAQVRPIAGNITKCPDGLLDHFRDSTASSGFLNLIKNKNKTQNGRTE